MEDKISISKPACAKTSESSFTFSKSAKSLKSVYHFVSAEFPRVKLSKIFLKFRI